MSVTIWRWKPRVLMRKPASSYSSYTLVRAPWRSAAPSTRARLPSTLTDANTSPSLPWRFRPVDTQRRIAIGARNIALYEARNLSSRAVTGQAVFNVTPAQAGRYFTKIQCFCFTEQTLQPFQDVRMPVTFYVDPAILNDPDARDISEITLSYTFYKVDRQASAR